MISGDLYNVCVNHSFSFVRSDIHGRIDGSDDDGGRHFALGVKLHLFESRRGKLSELIPLNGDLLRWHSKNGIQCFRRRLIRSG